MRSIKLPSWTERLLGFEPVGAPPHVFALDRERLRYGSFFRGPQGYAFEAYHCVDVPPGTFGDGPLGGSVAESGALHSLIGEFVAGLPGPIKEASLLLPDTWIRLTFTEIADLPSKADQRDEVLRFKLKRLVPFRVEELRVAATLLEESDGGADASTRLMIGFGIETLLGQIEEAFADAGVRVGRITNTTLALLGSLAAGIADDHLAALVLVAEDSYTVSFVRGGEPLLYRYKAFGDEGYAEAAAIRRDLRLTRNFVRDNVPDPSLGRLFLAASDEQVESWRSWLYEELETAPEPLALEHFPLTRSRASLPWTETAPLLGAACLEVR